MLKQLTNKFRVRKRRRARGQGITEYACLIAFIAVLVALVFGTSKGQLLSACSAAFSAISSNLNALAKSGS